MMHVAGFSGGKDSTALLVHLRELRVDYQAVFCDTGWEHPLTYAYIEHINQRLLGGALVVLKPDVWVPVGVSERYQDMRALVSRKGRVPSAKARFCTEYLKTNPMRAWLHSQSDEVTFYQGIRADESGPRAKMKDEEWSDFYDCWVKRPLFRWTAGQCFALMERHGISANPLYRLGAKRVGCFPCVLTGHAELQRMSAMLPEVWDRIAELETAAGRSFFPPGFIPDRFCSWRDPKSGKPLPLTSDVRRYLDSGQVGDLFPESDGSSCMSVYNLCE